MTAALVYKVRWRSAATATGGHRSSRSGFAGEHAASMPFVGHGDARRFDARRAARDPAERTWIRTFREPAPVCVAVLADVSRSMRYRGETTDRHARLCRLAEALAQASRRRGDSFAFVGCDRSARPDLYLPPCRNAGAAAELLHRLAAFVPDGAGAHGLLEGAHRLPARRSLVFLVSDMHVDLDLLARVRRRLAQHDVVPTVLEDDSEWRLPASWGLARLRDLESGRERLFVLRPGLARRIREAREAHREALRRLFLPWGRPPLWLHGPLDAHAFNRYFLEH